MSNKILEKFEFGKPTFLKFFNMPKEELLKILTEICGDRVSKETLEPSSAIHKEIVNDEPVKLTVMSWNSIIITPFGIDYLREHGQNEKIVEFNKFFKL